MDKFIKMLKTLKNIHTYLLITVFVDFVDRSCGSANFLFKQKSMSSLEIGEEITTDSPWWFSGPGEKQQLCHYARMKADLPFMDYNTTHNWYYHNSSRLNKVMRCPTLPTMFVFKEDWMEVIWITFLKSNIDDIAFDTEVIEEAEVVSWYEHTPEKQFMGPNRLDRLNAEDRKNLCAAARMFVNVVFLSDQVPEARIYKFSTSSNQEEVNLTLLCPTSPKLFISSGKSENKVKLLVVRDSIDSFTFEIDKVEPISVLPCRFSNPFKDFSGNDLLGLDINSRVTLCSIAREYASIPATDSDVQEAKLYSFKYNGRKEIRDIALQCPKLPELYLRLTDPVKKKITIILVQNPYENLIYTTDFFDYILPTEETPNSRKKVEYHWFSTLSTDDRWKLCYAVQKRISHSIRVKTHPQHFIESPKMRSFDRRYRIGGGINDFDDVAIRCSGLPEVYVRIARQSKNHEMKVLEIAINVDYFSLPRLRSLQHAYDEEQDNYDGE